MNDLLRDAIVNLQTCFSGSENTPELFSYELKLYIIPIEENQDKITSVQGNTGRFKATTDLPPLTDSPCDSRIQALSHGLTEIFSNLTDSRF
jgi:hypothetical protein